MPTEMLSHQFSARFKKADMNNSEFEKRLAQFMQAFIECYPHYIVKKEVSTEDEDWIFKFWVEKK